MNGDKEKERKEIEFEKDKRQEVNYQKDERQEGSKEILEKEVRPGRR